MSLLALTGSSSKVDAVIERALLSAVEMRNQTCKKICLVNLCDANIELFGVKGSPQRRAIQEYWNNVKRRSIRSYAKLLERWGVQKSETTTNLLKNEGPSPSPASTEMGSNIHPAQMNAPNDNVSEEEATYLSNIFSKKLSIGTPETTAPTAFPPVTAFPSDCLPSAFVTPVACRQNYPIATNSVFASSPQMSGNNDNNMWQSGGVMVTSPPPSVVFSSDAPTGIEAQKGTESNPFIIDVNLEYTDRNFPFDIVYVPHIEHGGWAREGIDIRVAIGVGDSGSWKAWMDDSIPELQDRAIMIRGRSRSSDYDALDSYHRNDMTSGVAIVHNEHMADMLLHPWRQAVYWRLITPPTMPLDNVILSGDSTKIVKKEKGVTRTVGEDDIQVLSYFVNWTIAKRKTGRQLTTSVDKPISKDAFA